ncbi:MAG: HEAT repeat domain-containing protein [Anaerolineales bacterium]|nr:HEAT repeat domain-containing protein [Anaerolineales bacterium]
MPKVLDNLLQSLVTETDPVSRLPLDHLSDLSADAVSELEDLWNSIPAARRLELLKELGDREAINFDLDFSSVYFLGLKDHDPGVIAVSINNLSEIENRTFFPSLLELISHTDTRVREAAAAALGYFIYLGELDEIKSEETNRAVQILLDVFKTGTSTEVRCRALESLGYSSHIDVPNIILDSLNSNEHPFIVSAIKAIGRSADLSWKPYILKRLHSTHPEIRLETVRSAGELELREAVEDLIELLDDVDRQIHLAAIWSLAQIGGDNIQEIFLHILSDCEDIEEADLLEDALDLLEFNAGSGDFLLLDLEHEPDDPFTAT